MIQELGPHITTPIFIRATIGSFFGTLMVPMTAGSSRTSWSKVRSMYFFLSALLKWWIHDLVGIQRFFCRRMRMLQEVISHVGMALAGDSISVLLIDYFRGLSRSLECTGGCNKIIDLSKSSWFVVYAVALPALIVTAMTSLFAQVASPSMVQSFQMRISSWNTPVLESCPWPTLDPTRSFSASVYGRLWLRVRVAADD